MSDGKQETVADIVAEMRDESHAGDASFLEWVGAKMRSYADRIEAAYGRHEAELCDLKRENDRLLAALKPVLECRVISDVFALALRGACMKKLPELISEAQHIYNGSEKRL